MARSHENYENRWDWDSNPGGLTATCSQGRRIGPDFAIPPRPGVPAPPANACRSRRSVPDDARSLAVVDDREAEVVDDAGGVFRNEAAGPAPGVEQRQRGR